MDIHVHDSVALLEDSPTTHYATGKPVVLHQGEVGTVIIPYKEGTFEVKFEGSDGRAFAILLVTADRLKVLRN